MKIINKYNINMIFEESNEYLIIGDFAYQNIFLDIKNTNPYLNIKYLTKKEVGNILEFEVDNNLIKYLIHNYNFDYIKSKKISNLLIFADESKFDLKKELLDKKIINKNYFGDHEFKNKKIYLFECNEDNELINLLKRHNIDFDFLYINEFLKESDFKDKIYLFKDYNEQFNFYYSFINKELIEGNKPNNIYLFMKNLLPFQIDAYSKIYNINSLYPKTTLLFSIEDINIIKKELFDNKKIECLTSFSSIKEDNIYLKQINKIIKDYELDKLDYKLGYLCLDEIISSLGYDNYSKYEGINIITQPIFKNNISLYIMNFESNVFYKIYKDDNVYLDRDLIKYGCNTSSDKTLLSKRLMSNFLKYSNSKIFGRVKIHAQDKIYDSEFINSFNLKYHEEPINFDGIYNNEASKLVISTFKDKYSLKEDNFYRNYDNSFRKFDFVNDKNISITDFEKYSTCPFKFYVSKYLKLDKFEETYYTKLGTFLHSIMEYINNNLDKDDINVEELFLKKLNSPIFKFDFKEKIMIETCVKPYFLFGVNEYYLKKREDLLNLGASKIVTEDKKTNTLTIEEEESIELISKSDCSFYHDDNLTIFDFKSGSKRFDDHYLKDGFDLQLPLYLFFNSFDEDKKYLPKGFFIVPILNDLSCKDNRYDKESTLSKYYIDGRYESKDTSYSSLITPLIKEKKKSKENNEKDNNDYDMEKIIKDSINASIRIIKKINNGEFDIKPVILPTSGSLEKTSCTYCSYRKLCFRKNNFIKLDVED